jgi:hypothetical protein
MCGRESVMDIDKSQVSDGAFSNATFNLASAFEIALE